MEFMDGHADIFADEHRCRCLHYPTYVGYSAILSDNAEVDADISASAWPSLVLIELIHSNAEEEYSAQCVQ